MKRFVNAMRVEHIFPISAREGKLVGRAISVATRGPVSRYDFSGECWNLIQAVDRRYAIEDEVLPLDPAKLR
jgi:hypothetical protein